MYVTSSASQPSVVGVRIARPGMAMRRWGCLSAVVVVAVIVVAVVVSKPALLQAHRQIEPLAAREAERARRR